MEFFTATGKLKKFFFTTRNVRCVHHGRQGTHRYDIQVLAKFFLRQELEYLIDVYRVTRGAHIEHL